MSDFIDDGDSENSDHDLDERQAKQEKWNKQRERVNAWRKANPEAAKAIAHRQYLKRKAEGRLKKASKESAAASRRKYNESKKYEVARLKATIAEYHYAFARNLTEQQFEVILSNARDHLGHS
jgi:hypothetical protein